MPDDVESPTPRPEATPSEPEATPDEPTTATTEPDSQAPDDEPADVALPEVAEPEVAEPAPRAEPGEPGPSVSEDTPPEAAESPERAVDEDPAPNALTPDPAPVATPWQRLRRSLRPAMSRSQLMAGVLCALLGFALVVQVRQTGQTELASLRQDDLVRLLDEVTVRAEQLDTEVSRLQDSRDELVSGTDQAQAALEVAQQRATTEGILSGRLPAQGPGVIIVVGEPDAAQPLAAQHLFNLLEELRNAGAEVVEVNGIRLVTSSSFVDGPTGRIVLDGSTLTPPYRWTVVGDPATLDRALEIPGGALPTIRSEGGTATTRQETLLTIEAVVEVTDPEFARPAADD